MAENLVYCEEFFDKEVKEDINFNLFLKKLRRITELPILVLDEIINGNISILFKNIFIKQFITIGEMVLIS